MPHLPHRFALPLAGGGWVDATRFRESDLEPLVEMHAEARTMRSLGGGRDRAVTERYLTDNLRHWEEHGFGLYALRLRPGGGFVGRAGLRRVPVLGRSEVEIAYALRAVHWGRGIASTVAVHLVALAREQALAPSLVAFTLPGNRGSRRVMERAGFAYERDFLHAGALHVLYRCPLGASAGEGSPS